MAPKLALDTFRVIMQFVPFSARSYATTSHATVSWLCFFREPTLLQVSDDPRKLLVRIMAFYPFLHKRTPCNYGDFWLLYPLEKNCVLLLSLIGDKCVESKERAAMYRTGYMHVQTVISRKIKRQDVPADYDWLQDTIWIEQQLWIAAECKYFYLYEQTLALRDVKDLLQWAGVIITPNITSCRVKKKRKFFSSKE